MSSPSDRYSLHSHGRWGKRYHIPQQSHHRQIGELSLSDPIAMIRIYQSCVRTHTNRFGMCLCSNEVKRFGNPDSDVPYVRMAAVRYSIYRQRVFDFIQFLSFSLSMSFAVSSPAHSTHFTPDIELASIASHHRLFIYFLFSLGEFAASLSASGFHL